MNRRKAALVIQAAPEGVDITIEPVGAPGETQTGQAPGTFQVSAGQWRVIARKSAYKTQTREIKLDSVDTMPLFFALERQPARLEIFTDPPNATLYVRGNRARNPYVQDVEPGVYEIYAEAPTYESRTSTYTLVPGERERVPFKLKYVQRSGRPELIGFWTATGAVAAGGLVLARLQTMRQGQRRRVYRRVGHRDGGSGAGGRGDRGAGIDSDPAQLPARQQGAFSHRVGLGGRCGGGVGRDRHQTHSGFGLDRRGCWPRHRGRGGDSAARTPRRTMGGWRSFRAAPPPDCSPVP